MVKISALPKKSTLDLSGKVPIVSNGETDYIEVSDLIGSLSTIFDHVASGLVWTADSAGVNRNGSMSSGVVYVNSRPLAINSISGHSFTASKDTYIDILVNLDGTYTVVFTEVANNDPSPVLAASSIRVGIVVTGAGSIATAASINQGQENRVLPIASSVAYSVTDSLGNLICSRDPNRSILGYKQIISAFTSTTAGSYVDLTGLNMPINPPAGRKLKITAFCFIFKSSQAAGNGVSLELYDATAAAEVGVMAFTTPTANYAEPGIAKAVYTPPSSGVRNLKVRVQQAAAGTITADAGATNATWAMVELK